MMSGSSLEPWSRTVYELPFEASVHPCPQVHIRVDLYVFIQYFALLKLMPQSYASYHYKCQRKIKYYKKCEGQCFGIALKDL